MKPIKPKKGGKLTKGVVKEFPEEPIQGFRQQGVQNIMGGVGGYRPEPKPAVPLRSLKPVDTPSTLSALHPVLVGKTPTTVEKFSKKKGK